VAPPWKQILYPKDNEIHNFVEAFLLYITMHLVSLTYVQFQRRKNVKIGHVFHFSSLPKGPIGGKNPEIYNSCPPYPKEFAKNWSSGYQEVEIIKLTYLITDYVGHTLIPKRPNILIFTILVKDYIFF
jgi:hypothetical protein